MVKKIIIFIILLFVSMLLISCNNIQTCSITLYDEDGGLIVNTIEGETCNYIRDNCNHISYCEFENILTGTYNSIGSCTCIPESFRYI